MSLHKYKDIFGRPGEGAHSVRIGSYAMVDIVGTLAAALVFSIALNTHFVYMLVLLLLLASILHWAFGVDTALNRQLGIS
jgi:hypothetical protein